MAQAPAQAVVKASCADEVVHAFAVALGHVAAEAVVQAIEALGARVLRAEELGEEDSSDDSGGSDGEYDAE